MDVFVTCYFAGVQDPIHEEECMDFDVERTIEIEVCISCDCTDDLFHVACCVGLRL